MPFPRYIVEFFTAELANLGPSESLVSNLGQQEINALLAYVCLPNATTYSFRRNYIHRVLDRCVVDGEVDFEKVKMYTIHDNVNTLKACYQRHVSDTPKEDPVWLDSIAED